MALFSRTFVAAAVLAVLTLPVLAQPAAATDPATAQTQTQAQTQAPSATPGARMMRRAPNQAKMQERMAQRQAALKHSLELSPAQEPAWNTFIATMQPGERPARLGQLSRDEMQKLTTPERIERMRAQRAQRHAQADLRADAALAFYAELNPAQQKTFDKHTANHHHMNHWKQAPGARWEKRQNQAPASAQ
ncbi:MAG: Spy/CpxP family protein refolding chaperone [Burkholderiaceae bacterium]|nr:Spy/CpxP family protein refolding chaperone [Burkholderiaceae bacterium]